jgi:hypothetical protein
VNRPLFARIQAPAAAIEERRGGAERRRQLLDGLSGWPRLFAGCHTSRDTEAALIDRGFTLDRRARFSFRPTLLATPIAPRILGCARLTR